MSMDHNHHEDHHHDHLKDALEMLKKSSVRITPQRHAILEFLTHSMSHPTADEIYKALEGKFPNMSVATVYNNLRVFREVGLVKELTYGDSSSRFDFVTSDHYHVICVNCGSIVDFHTLDWMKWSIWPLMLPALRYIITGWKSTGSARSVQRAGLTKKVGETIPPTFFILNAYALFFYCMKL